jgi:phage gp46-like protein
MDFTFSANYSSPGGKLTLTKNVDLSTDIFNSLNINYGSFFQRPTFGSKLHLIKKITESNIRLAQQYVLEALDWLKQTGRATTITAEVAKDPITWNRLNISVTATQATGLIITYQQYKMVGN